MKCAYKKCPDAGKSDPSTELKPCHNCKRVFYCSKLCQTQDWYMGHQFNCNFEFKGTAQSLQIQESQTRLNSSLIKPGFVDDISIDVASRGFLSPGDQILDYESNNKNLIYGRPPKISDFESQKGPGLGKGSYGKVELVKEKQTGQLYAMKVMKKETLKRISSVENLKREINVQFRLNHENLVSLRWYFEDKKNIYMVMDYAANGNLFYYLRKKKKFSEREAYKYFSQTCSGIYFLHKNNIIHRDIKPENLLLDKNLNIKLCDFGWCVEGDETRNTFCGTLDYMAPEMIQNGDHNHTLDIWSLGVLLFELVHGRAPFSGRSPAEKCSKIMKNTIVFDEGVSDPCRELISGLLKLNANDRFTMLEIFQHPWVKKFEDIEVKKSENPAKRKSEFASSLIKEAKKKKSSSIHTKPKKTILVVGMIIKNYYIEGYGVSDIRLDEINEETGECKIFCLANSTNETVTKEQLETTVKKKLRGRSKSKSKGLGSKSVENSLQESQGKSFMQSSLCEDALKPRSKKKKDGQFSQFLQENSGSEEVFPFGPDDDGAADNDDDDDAKVEDDKISQKDRSESPIKPRSFKDNSEQNSNDDIVFLDVLESTKKHKSSKSRKAKPTQGERMDTFGEESQQRDSTPEPIPEDKTPNFKVRTGRETRKASRKGGRKASAKEREVLNKIDIYSRKKNPNLSSDVIEATGTTDAKLNEVENLCNEIIQDIKEFGDLNQSTGMLSTEDTSRRKKDRKEKKEKNIEEYNGDFKFEKGLRQQQKSRHAFKEDLKLAEELGVKTTKLRQNSKTKDQTAQILEAVGNLSSLDNSPTSGTHFIAGNKLSASMNFSPTPQNRSRFASSDRHLKPITGFGAAGHFSDASDLSEIRPDGFTSGQQLKKKKSRDYEQEREAYMSNYQDFYDKMESNLFDDPNKVDEVKFQRVESGRFSVNSLNHSRLSNEFLAHAIETRDDVELDRVSVYELASCRRRTPKTDLSNVPVGSSERVQKWIESRRVEDGLNLDFLPRDVVYNYDNDLLESSQHLKRKQVEIQQVLEDIEDGEPVRPSRLTEIAPRRSKQTEKSGWDW
eukprot:CAMPEP_0115014012 /NCGR_PEP_ID=MMETSP0216-20121206/25786_1 /TAXON_ID=223996 /ORGANISM="Protocruzia adherens, Strain Boccale" /LENGTH=1067 /DNA_ID=CAMNT_0002383593 /DNA_START=223 /DNA_END=3423 /DNA_ORIENTATION=+